MRLSMQLELRSRRSNQRLPENEAVVEPLRAPLWLENSHNKRYYYDLGDNGAAAIEKRGLEILAEPISEGSLLALDKRKLFPVIHHLTHAGLLSKIPAKLVTPKVLLQQDRYGVAPIAIAICRKDENVSKHLKVLGDIIWDYKDGNGVSLLHLLAKNGKLNQVEPELLNRHILEDGVALDAIAEGYIDHVPKALQKEALNQEQGGVTGWDLLACTNKADQVPQDWWALEILKRKAYPGTILHRLAMKNMLKAVNPALLTKELLLLKDQDGTTVLTHARKAGCLDQVPADVLADIRAERKLKADINAGRVKKAEATLDVTSATHKKSTLELYEKVGITYPGID